MIELLTDPAAWVSFATLTILEIVLGIDNIIFLSIVSERLPPEQQRTARFIGLSLALLMRIGLLFSITWIIGLTDPVFSIDTFEASWRDLILLGGGLFLLGKATVEIYHTVEAVEEVPGAASRATSTFAAAIAQIVVLDVIFSLDSILTAVGLTNHLPIMIAAVVVSIICMLVAAEPVAAFVKRHLSVKMLALAFLLLIGVVLVADGLHFHIPKGYIYFSLAFTIGVQSLVMLANKRRTRRAL